MHMSFYKCVHEQCRQYRRAHRREKRETAHVVTCSRICRPDKPFTGKEVVYYEAKCHRPCDNRQQVYDGRPTAHLAGNQGKGGKDKPLSINDNAMGIEPVAHTYIGTAITSTASIDNNGVEPSTEKNPAGTYTVINAAINSPMTSHPPILPTKSINP